MRTATYVAVFIGGMVACFLLVSLGVLDRVDGLPGTQEDPVLSLPTYLSFVSVMMTAVTAVLAALGIGIGVVAAYTFREIRDEAKKVVVAQLEARLTDEVIKEHVNRIAFAQKQTPTVAELEEGFDPQDDGNR